MDKVKVLYVKNLAAQVTEDLLTQTFSAYGEVEKAKKLKGFKNIFNIDMYLIQIKETFQHKYFKTMLLFISNNETMLARP